MHSTQSKTFNVTSELAFISDGWTDGLAEALLEHKPRRMELVGDWSDLRPFSRLADSVESLRIAGTIQNGRIDSICGIASFTNLKHLEMVSLVKSGYDGLGLTQLESCDVSWQPDVHHLLVLPRLYDANIRAYPYSDLRNLPEGSNVQSLGLGQPAVCTVGGLNILKGLTHIRMTRARKLTSLEGVEDVALRNLEIDEARQLTDITALENASHLEALRLINVSPQIDLKPICKIEGLRRVHVAGKGVPVLPWLTLISKSRIEWIAGLWNSDALPEGELRNALPTDRRISRFDSTGSSGIRPLWVELE